MSGRFESYDVAVLGGGPAGIAAALGLATAGARVTLFEPTSAPHHEKPGEVLSADIHTLLQEMCAADCLDKCGAAEVAAFRMRWRGHSVETRETCISTKRPPVIVSRSSFEAALIEKVVASGVNVVKGRGLQMKVGAKEPNQIGCWIEWKKGPHASHRHGKILVDLVVDAAGRNGRSKLPRERLIVDRLIAILAYFTLADLPDQAPVVRIEAVRNGWLYGTPIPPKGYVVGYFTDGDLLPHMRSDPGALLGHICRRTELFSDLAPPNSSITRIATCNAASTLRKVLNNGRNTVAIGDAAATYDPLNGGGVTTALAKGLALSRLINGGAAIEHAFKMYAETERAAFSDFLTSRRAIYSQCTTGSSAFWQRRISQQEGR